MEFLLYLKKQSQYNSLFQINYWIQLFFEPDSMLCWRLSYTSIDLPSIQLLLFLCVFSLVCCPLLLFSSGILCLSQVSLLLLVSAYLLPIALLRFLTLEFFVLLRFLLCCKSNMAFARKEWTSNECECKKPNTKYKYTSLCTGLCNWKAVCFYPPITCRLRRL